MGYIVYRLRLWLQLWGLAAVTLLIFPNVHGNGEHFGFSHLPMPEVSTGLVILAILIGLIIFLVFLVKTKRLTFSYESNQY